MASTLLMKTIFLVLIFVSFTISPATSTAPEDCASESANPCVNKAKALHLKVIAIAAILVSSMIGVGAPLFSRNVPFLQPDGNIFTIVKCFASGIILGTGFMHVLPDSFEMFSSQCLEENPWHKFPFSGFLAMLSGLITLVIDSMATSLYTSKHAAGIVPHGHGHGPGNDAEYTNRKKFLMAFFFAITTPFGIALGIALSTLQGSVKMQIKCFIAALLGCGGMSVIAKWA
ncbi:hypothetical protein Bca52824_038100 [Brassica carinata]|uniref:Fe(2+) transport protein 1-like n=1 Tax=Brassica carinata TaxID=52824 RepID=A0A8X7RNB3_BRACI|nr:hypothetical protein Bca52824_038100 [Brassica carinata]